MVIRTRHLITFKILKRIPACNSFLSNHFQQLPIHRIFPSLHVIECILQETKNAPSHLSNFHACNYHQYALRKPFMNNTLTSDYYYYHYQQKININAFLNICINHIFSFTSNQKWREKEMQAFRMPAGERRKSATSINHFLLHQINQRRKSTWRKSFFFFFFFCWLVCCLRS